MNRREAFKAIGASLAGTAAEGATVQAVAAKPQMVVITCGSEIDPDSLSKIVVDRITGIVREQCRKAGWGHDMPVMVFPPGINFEVYPKEPINVTIPPNTIVEQIDDYTAIYPVGKPPSKQ